MTSSYTSSLSAELKETAVKELNEPKNDGQVLEAINKLRDAFKEAKPELKLMRDDNIFILRYLRARKFDHNQALKILINYHVQRAEWTEAFEKIDKPAMLRESIVQGQACPLKGKSKDGCAIVVVRPGLQDPPSLIDLFATAFITVEKLLDKEENQVKGIVIVTDLAYSNGSIRKQLTPSLASRFAKTMQDCIPVRIKQVNITNQPKFFDVIFGIMQPFLNEKFKQRFVVHGTDFSKLYETIDRLVLPHMFAGSGPDIDVDEWKNKLLEEGTSL